MSSVQFDPKAMLATLRRHGVDFVVIGGLAGMTHGSALPSYDLDIAYARDGENLKRMAAALTELESRLRGAPRDVPFLLDARTLRADANFTFEPPSGSLDIVGDPAGAPRYDQLKHAALHVEIDGELVLVASLDHLIAMKEAAGRPKDLLMATEYRMLSDETRSGES